MKQLLISLLLISCWLPQLDAYQKQNNDLYYMKFGIVDPPVGSSGVLPAIGLGARFQRGEYGYDLSANLGSILFINYVSLKGMFLFYPQPEKTNQLYFGFGPGIGHYSSTFPMMHYGNGARDRGVLTLEAVLGYEFRHSPNFATFVQLELTQPTFGLGGNSPHFGNKPGVALSVGVGF